MNFINTGKLEIGKHLYKHYGEGALDFKLDLGLITEINNDIVTIKKDNISFKYKIILSPTSDFIGKNVYNLKKI